MADISTIEATNGGAASQAAETGKPQGEKPSRPPLYDQLSEAGKKSFNAERFGKLGKLDDLVAEIGRLDGEIGNGIRVPGKDATKEQWDAYRKAMQIPLSPDGYSLSKPTLPNGLQYSDRLEKWFRQELFEAGVPNAAASKIFDDWNRTQSEAYVAAVAARKKADEDSRAAAAKAALDSLQAEYKDALPQMMQLRDAAIARFGGQELVDAFRNARLPNGLTLDNDPRVNKMLIEVGRRMDVDTMVTGAAGSGREEPRQSLPKTPGGYTLTYPGMEKEVRFRVKAD
jgi:hypothetical protein